MILDFPGEGRKMLELTVAAAILLFSAFMVHISGR
jgi:hypothetical protein